MNKRRIKRNFDEQAALVLENNKPQTKTPKKRQWRANMVWKKEDQIEHQTSKPNKRKEPPTELAHHLDITPGVKRQVPQPNVDNKPKQYVPSKNNWRYNRVWRRDMVWKRENRPAVPNTNTPTKTEKEKSTGGKDSVVPGAKGKDNRVSGAKIITASEPCVVNTADSVTPAQKQLLPLQEKLTKRKRPISDIIPCKKRLLEAIPWRSVQPHATPRFLWNLETEMEWVFTAFEDLRL